MSAESATKFSFRFRATTNFPALVSRSNSHPSACARGRADSLWIHDGAGARSLSIARQSRERHRAETGAGGAKRNECEQFQSRRGQ